LIHIEVVLSVTKTYPVWIVSLSFKDLGNQIFPDFGAGFSRPAYRFAATAKLRHRKLGRLHRRHSSPFEIAINGAR